MYVLKIVNRHIPYEDAEEVAHDAFIRIYESLAQFKGPEGFRKWMAAISDPHLLRLLAEGLQIKGSADELARRRTP